MPAPASLTTASHTDFELEVVAGAWPADISGDMVFSSVQQSGSLGYAIFDWGAICQANRSGPAPRVPGTSARRQIAPQSKIAYPSEPLC